MNALEAYTFGIIYGTIHQLETGTLPQEECIRVIKDAIKHVMDAEEVYPVKEDRK